MDARRELAELEELDRLERRAAGGFSKPLPIGKDGFKDALAETLKEAGAGTRAIAAFGTGLRGAYEGIKQLIPGMGDQQAIEANEQIAKASPVAAAAGNLAMFAVPFAGVSKVGTAAKVGAGIGLTNPVAGEQTFENIAKGKLVNTALSTALAGGGQAAANWVAPKISNAIASNVARRRANSGMDDNLQAGLDAGYVAPPAASNPSFINTALESVAGKVSTQQAASAKNFETTNALARRAVGIPENEPLTREALQSVRNNAISKGYAPVTQLGTVPVDKTYITALEGIAARYTGPAKSFGGAIKSEVPELAEGFKVGQFDAGDAIQAVQYLRDQAGKAYASGDKALGKANREISEAIEGQIERYLASQGKDAEMTLRQFRDARKLIAKTHTVESALDANGNIIASKFAQRLKDGKPLEGELETIGRFAAAQPKAVASPEKGGGISNALTAGAGGLAGAFGGDNNMALDAAMGVGGTLAARHLMRSAILSRMGQRSLAQPSYSVPITLRAGNALAQYAPAGGAVLGLEALGQ